jgi:hypothetical protein
MALLHPIKITKIILMVLIAILLAACQEEYVEISEPDKNTAFSASDTLADLIMKVSLKDGSFDNVFDNCSEISINFPYAVQIRNEIITISSIEDIEKLKQEYLPLKNPILIRYPVTVTFSDYSETELKNPGQLQKIQNQFNATIEDDDIECIDFIYPFEMNLYNTEFQKPDRVRAHNDRTLHSILKNINELIVEIDYPIQVELYNGTTVSISNNVELKNEIMNAAGSCDEEDEININEKKHKLKIQ